MFKTINLLVMILILKCNLSEAIISKTENVWSARQMGQLIAVCFSQNPIRNCLENRILEAIDKAIANNETWQLSDYLVVEKIATPNTIQNLFGEEERSLSDAIAEKLLQLAQTRAIRLQLSPMFMRTLQKRSFSSALDDFANMSTTEPDSADNADGGEEEQLEQEEGTKQRKLNGLVDDKIALIKSGRKKPFKKQKPSYSSPLDFAISSLPNSYLFDNNHNHKNKYKQKQKHKHKHKNKNKYKNKHKNKNKKIKNKIFYSLFNIKTPKGRKKKDKDKNMAMIGGMAMIAMVAQMFLGKVILIAGAAFVMAKVALLISVLVSSIQKKEF